MENRHIPVLLSEVLEAFAQTANGVIVDGTLGGAGHTRALLEQLPHAKVLGCDQDPAAVHAAQEKLAQFVERGRFTTYNANFSRLVERDAGIPEGFGPPWAGVLLDLGYSSNQLEDPAYGMSFQVDGPLDMRLSRNGQSAWDLLCEATDQELGDILKTYGEIPGAHRLARRIKEAVDKGEVRDSTLSLAGFLERINRSRDKIHPATLVFQALRIAVNDELRVLDHFLNNVILYLDKAAVVAVITFHSLEDRLVKQWGLKNAAVLTAVTRKPIEATVEEVKANPRSRSAKLRVYHKI